MATQSSVLAWRIPGMVEPGGLPSMGSHRVGHDWSDLAVAGILMEGRRVLSDLLFNMLSSLVMEKAMATHSSTLAWKIPQTEEPGRLQSMGLLRVRRTERLHFHFSLSCIGQGNGNPLQCSCLENPRDEGAWWASIYGVAQSWTRLKQLSSIYIYTLECFLVQLENCNGNLCWHFYDFFKITTFEV